MKAVLQEKSTHIHARLQWRNTLSLFLHSLSPFRIWPVSSLMTNGKNIDVFEAVKFQTWLLADLEGKKLIMINIMSKPVCRNLLDISFVAPQNACSFKGNNIANICLQTIKWVLTYKDAHYLEASWKIHSENYQTIILILLLLQLII